MVILVPFGGPATLRLSSYGKPKSENPFFCRTQNGPQRFGWASNFFGKKTKVVHWRCAKSETSDIKNGLVRAIFIFWCFDFWFICSPRFWTLSERDIAPWYFFATFPLITNSTIIMVHLIKNTANSDVQSSSEWHTPNAGLHGEVTRSSMLVRDIDKRSSMQVTG